MDSDRAAERKAVHLAYSQVLPAMYARAEACQPKAGSLGPLEQVETGPEARVAARKLQERKVALEGVSREEDRTGLLRQWRDVSFDETEGEGEEASGLVPMES